MNEQYISDQKFQTCYETLSGVRSKIARDLPLKPGMRILDLATGYAYFAIEVAKLGKSLKIAGIDISQSSIENARKNTEKENLKDQIEILEMDAAKMSFKDHEFDMVVNFTGLEDIHMTRGKEGVKKTFLEVSRVLKPESYFCFAVMPPEEMETEAQKIEVALFSYICNATWLSAVEYEDLLRLSRFELLSRKSYYTGMKLTPEQAKTEIRFAVENDPKIYGIKTRSFEDTWSKFGNQIIENGLGYYSKVLLMTAKKIGDIN